MRRLSILVWLLAVSVVAQAQTPDKAMRDVSYRGVLKAGANLRIWSLAGVIRVTTWDKDSVVVRGSVPVKQEFFCGGNSNGLSMKCGVDVPGRVQDPERGSWLEFTVPRRMVLWIKSASADISVIGFGGDLEAYSVSGRIHVTGKPHSLSLESMAGDIDVTVAAATLRLKTASGAIIVKGAVEDVEATSVSGAVRLTGANVERGRFESIEGNIQWQGPLAHGSSLEFSSHSGTVELALPPETGGDFTVSTYRGSVRNDFGTTKLVDARDLNGKELHFSLRGDDRTRVVVRNFKGKVLLVRS